MSTHHVLAAVTLAVASAFTTPTTLAQEATPDTPTTQNRSVATRAEVLNDLRAAKESRDIAHGEAGDHDFTRHFRPMLTRVQVAAEAAEARRLGVALVGDAPRFPTPQEIESIRRAGIEAVERRIALDQADAR